MTLRLHWSPDSANLIIRIALEMFGMPYEAVRVDRSAATHRSPAYLAKNPFGLIPVLEDGELVLYETGAILWHVAERAGSVGPDGPSMDDPVARAATLTAVFSVCNTVHADLRIAFYPHRYTAGPAESANLRQAMARRVAEHCAVFEGQMARGGLVGAEPSIADIYLAVCLRWAQLYPSGMPLLASLDPWPRLSALASRLEDHSGARAAFAAESIPENGALTRPQRPDLPADQVTGGA